MKLYDQDRTHVYNYTGQKLYYLPVHSPDGVLWGYNIHMSGARKPLGTFDTQEEAQAEINAIRDETRTEKYISGFSDYNADKNFFSWLRRGCVKSSKFAWAITIFGIGLMLVIAFL